MKKRIILSLLLVVLSLTACNGRKNSETNTASGAAKTSKSESQISAGSHKVLVAYFSRVGNTDLPEKVDTVSSASLNVTKNGVQGNTEIVAKMIQKDVAGSDLFFIQREDKLKADKLISDHSVIDREGKKEHDANVRPKLITHVKNMDSYDMVILVYPNWWYDMPMAVYSFLDEYDLSGKTIVPFCTSGGSGFSNTIKIIGKLEPKATILEGLAISQNLSNNMEDDVKKRLSKLGFIK
jgi:flavodoxin